MRSLLWPVLGLATAVFLAGQAPAYAAVTTVDFEEFRTTKFTQGLGDSFQSGGLRFTSSYAADDAFISWGMSEPTNAQPGGATIGQNYSDMISTVSSASGALFDLVSIDLADPFNGDFGGEVRFSFVRPGVGTETVSVELPRAGGLHRFTFNQSGISSFNIAPTTTRGRWVQFDNITYVSGTPAAVPEPQSWALLIAGFGVVGGAIRSNRRKSGRLVRAML